MEVVRELCSFEGRLAGTDAERRAGNRLAERLRAMGRHADTEPTYVHPQIGVVYAAHCLIALGGSLAGVAIPPLGFGLVLLAATSMYLDLNARVYLLRLLFFRRASQNVVSPGGRPDAPARLVVSAHYDAGRSGAVYGPRPTRLLAAAQRRLRVPMSGWRLVFWSTAALLPLLGARMAEIDAGWVSALQLPPTLVILVASFAFVDIALSPIVPGADENASGTAAALSLADELEREPTQHLDVWFVLTGAGECLAQGMRAFLRQHRADLDPSTTYLLNLDSIGAGEVRFETGEGPAVTFGLDSRLTELCAAIAEADAEADNRFRAKPLRHGSITDALPARLARIPATTITCRHPDAAVPSNAHTLADTPDALDPAALERAHTFALALIRRLDIDVSRRLVPAEGQHAAAEPDIPARPRP
jgi:hypothetical protein